jgi:hypothetical protein
MTRDYMIEEALRRALAEEAESVQVAPDALGTIRGRIERRRARWWLPRFGATGGLGVAVAGAAAVVVLGAGVAAVALRWPAHRPAPGPAASAVSATGTAASGANLPVYYLGLSHRLYREYHVLGGPGLTTEQKVAAAVQAMLDRPADDPDYHSPWPAGASLRRASVEARVVTVDLSGAAAGPAGGVAAQATTAMAAQQLVWTATAQVPGSTEVRLLLDGVPATSLWGAPLGSDVLQRGPAADVLAPIWIIDPQQGTVQGHRFEVHLAGIVSEATMRLRVLDQSSGTVIDDQVVHLSGGAPGQGTATATFELPSGRYTVEGYVLSERDGSEQVYDNHQFSVG